MPKIETLSELEHADLIRRLVEIELSYSFKHNLVQETAYRSLLRNDRRALHRACAEALESAYPQQLDEYATLLARHYAEAGDDAKTFIYALRAGKLAAYKQAHVEALMEFDLARNAAQRAGFEGAQLIDLYTVRGRTYEMIGKQPEAERNYLELQELGHARGDKAMELAALVPLTTLYTVPNIAQDMDKAHTLNIETLSRARALGDRPAEAKVLWNLMLEGYFNGQLQPALEYGEQSVALARELNLRDQLAVTLNDSSRVYLGSGQAEKGIAALEEAREIFRQENNLPMLVDNLSSTGDLLSVIGRLDDALEMAKQSEALSRQIGNVWNLAYSGIVALQVYLNQGRMTELLDAAAATIRYGQESGFFVAYVAARGALAAGYGILGMPEHGIEILEEPLPPQVESVQLVQSWLTANLARLYITIGDLAAAHAAAAQAAREIVGDDLSNYGPELVMQAKGELALAEKRYQDIIEMIPPFAARVEATGVRLFLADLLEIEGKAWYELGELVKAEATLQHARRIAEPMSARPILIRILAALADVAVARGESEPAAQLWHAAREYADFIAAHAPQEFRATFRAMPSVRRLFEHPA